MFKGYEMNSSLFHQVTMAGVWGMVFWGRASARLAVLLCQEGTLALLCGQCLAHSWGKLPWRGEGAVALSLL